MLDRGMFLFNTQTNVETNGKKRMMRISHRNEIFKGSQSEV